MNRCAKHRLFFTASSKRLRRARRLYVRICLPAIKRYGNKAIYRMSCRMMENGLYSDHDKSGRSARQGIGSHYFYLTKHRYPILRNSLWAWNDWCKIVHWDTYDGLFTYDKPRIFITAVIKDIQSPIQEIWQ